jgi:hypothetical protein
MNHPKKKVDIICVGEDGMITGITRYTRIPFRVLSLSEENMMGLSHKKEYFFCRRSDCEKS